MSRSRLLFAVVAAAVLAACTRELTLTRGPVELDAGVSRADASGLPQVDAATAQCESEPCAQCANGIDDDGDGDIDGFDSECSAPFDDDEASFATGLHGDNPNRKFSDCFFDGNSGKNDGCSRPTCCAEPSAGQQGTGCEACEVSVVCLDTCLPLVPNGCDCFGCCEVRHGGTLSTIVLRDGCKMDSLQDAEACPPCVLDATCRNDCGECELCAGKSPDQLPPSCGPNGSYVCETSQVCSEQSPCVAGDYCAQGCCIPFLR